jgi:hypothetical protein
MSQNKQRTEEWYQERLGHITGSRFHDIIAVSAYGKPLAARKAVIAEVTLEILTNSPGAMWTSKATRWGVDHEPEARLAYEAHTGQMCLEVGFIKHKQHKQVGCSPDHLIGAEGGGEIKCPLTPAIHLDTLLHGMPEEHMAQCQGGMWCTGAEWWDFVSYHPLFPDGMQIYIQRIPRNQAYIIELEDKVLNAVCEINLNVKELRDRYGAGNLKEAA